MLLGVDKDIGVHVDGGNRFDTAVSDIGGQEAGTPAVALSAGPHLYHTVLVGHVEFPVCENLVPILFK